MPKRLFGFLDFVFILVLIRAVPGVIRFTYPEDDSDTDAKAEAWHWSPNITAANAPCPGSLSRRQSQPVAYAGDR